MTKFTILIDNRKGPDGSLKTEHGLSIYFEQSGKRYLFDVGASGKFISNAAITGVSIEEIQTLILSHGHNDHTGGLARFLETNSVADIYASDIIPHSQFYTCRNAGKRAIGSDLRPFISLSKSSRLHLIGSDINIADNVRLFFCKCRKHPGPAANQTLSIVKDNVECNDDFSHEIGIAVNTGNGVVIMSACTHNGLLNTLESCSNIIANERIIGFIGGTHLVEGEFETDDEIRDIACQIRERYPELKIHTGHCTSENAFNIFHEVLGDKISMFYSGAEIIM